MVLDSTGKVKENPAEESMKHDKNSYILYKKKSKNSVGNHEKYLDKIPPIGYNISKFVRKLTKLIGTLDLRKTGGPKARSGPCI